MIDRLKNLLLLSGHFSSWMVVLLVVGVLTLFNSEISHAEEVGYSDPLPLNDPFSTRFSDLNKDYTVYPLNDFELPADNEGKIDTILLRNKHKKFIAHLVKATSPHVKIIVFLKSAEIEAFRTALIPFLREQDISPERIHKVVFLPLVTKQPYWMRDNGILFINNKANLITFVGCRSHNSKEVFLDEYIRSSPLDNIVFNDSKVTFDFPGGEVVASESYVFCKWRKLFEHRKPSLTRQEFEHLCKKELIDFRGIKTPDLHLDLWLTPIDDNTVLLGDVVLGRDIMGKIPKSERSKIVNRFIKAEMASGYIRKRGGKFCKRFFSKMVFKDRHKFLECVSVDAVKGYLEERGFTVIPIPSIGHLEIGPDSYYSYNNVLMESYIESSGREIKNVILPEYGHTLDNKARQIWESLGFVVKQFPMNNIARKGGAIRCSSQRVPSSVSYMQGGK